MAGAVHVLRAARIIGQNTKELCDVAWQLRASALRTSAKCLQYSCTHYVPQRRQAHVAAFAVRTFWKLLVAGKAIVPLAQIVCFVPAALHFFLRVAREGEWGAESRGMASKAQSAAHALRRHICPYASCASHLAMSGSGARFCFDKEPSQGPGQHPMRP